MRQQAYRVEKIDTEVDSYIALGQERANPARWWLIALVTGGGVWALVLWAAWQIIQHFRG